MILDTTMLDWIDWIVLCAVVTQIFTVFLHLYALLLNTTGLYSVEMIKSIFQRILGLQWVSVCPLGV